MLENTLICAQYGACAASTSQAALVEELQFCRWRNSESAKEPGLRAWRPESIMMSSDISLVYPNDSVFVFLRKLVKKRRPKVRPQGAGRL